MLNLLKKKAFTKNRGSMFDTILFLPVWAILTAWAIAYVNSFIEPQKISESVDIIGRIHDRAKATDLAVLDLKDHPAAVRDFGRVHEVDGKIYLTPLKRQISSGRIDDDEGIVEKGYIAIHGVTRKECVQLVAPLAPRFYETFVVKNDSMVIRTLNGTKDLVNLVGLVPAPSYDVPDPRSKVSVSRLAALCDNKESETKDIVFFMQREYDPSAFHGGGGLASQIQEFQKRLDRNHKKVTKTRDNGETYEEYEGPEAVATYNRMKQLIALKERMDKMYQAHEKMLKLREMNQRDLDEKMKQ